MSFILMHTYVILKHILNIEDNAVMARDERGVSTELPWSREKFRDLFINNERLLDFSGPKLIKGLDNWLRYYQSVGAINLKDQPLFVSILFKLVVLSTVAYRMTVKIWRFYSYQVVDYRNPIFVFISLLSVAAFSAQFITTIRLNLLQLSPLYKILTTPKLCFLKQEALETMGSKFLRTTIIFDIYQSILLHLLDFKDWHDFVINFSLVGFLFDIYIVTTWTTYQSGMTHLDLYVRGAFAHWLLGLSTHLKQQFEYLHEIKLDTVPSGSASGRSRARVTQSGEKFITFDEVQRSLNNMDDHLEVLRNVQIGSMVFASLNAFLTNGALILLDYLVLVNQLDYFHGIILLLVVFNFMVITFFTYCGDSFLYYALGQLVNAVEDEYFTESNRRIYQLANQSRTSGTGKRPTSGHQGAGAVGEADGCSLRSSARIRPAPAVYNERVRKLLPEQFERLLVKRADVLFVREFLHQFEHHLATPWSRLTLKSHLQVVHTYVTLVAAQIIFEHEN